MHLASIIASMRPRNLEQAFAIWAFFMAFNSFLIRLINSSFVLHGILLVHLLIAPHTKKVHQIQVRRVWRPNVKRDKINEVVAQPKLRFSRCMARLRVLFPHVWPFSSHLTYPGQFVHLKTSRYSTMLTFSYSTMLTFKPFWKMYGGMA